MIALTAKDVLPQDGTSGTLAGRVWLPEAAGPAVVAVRGEGVFDFLKCNQHGLAILHRRT